MAKNKIEYTTSYAVFSDDRKHRLMLCRTWDPSRPAAMVIGLNPSTADEHEDDPTIGFVRRVLDSNGYGSLYMVNLFTMVTPHPEELEHPSKCRYDQAFCIDVWKHTLAKNPTPTTVVFAWGQFKTFGRDQVAVKELGQFAQCFGKNKNGSPRHGMYLKPTTKLQPWL